MIDFLRRLRRSLQTGADENLSKREQIVVGAICYLVMLASWINLVMDMPYVGAFLAC